MVAADRSATAGSSTALGVLVDATNCKPGQGGIRTYTTSVVRELGSRREVEVTVLTSTLDAFPGIATLEAPESTRRYSRRVVWRELNLQRLADASGAEVVLALTPELPLRRLRQPTVMVVHDVGPLVEPRLYGRGRWLRYWSVLRANCATATAIVCVSEATRNALITGLKVPADKCVVIYEAAQPFQRPSVANGVDPYVLYVGSLRKHKNISTLLRAWPLDGEGLTHALTLVGPHDRRAVARLTAVARERGVGNRVRHRGFVSGPDLAALYRDAAAVVVPSLYEGFGLPVLEAMSAGSPVVASRIPAIEEVAGNAAILVQQPRDPRAWRNAISQVLSDATLREELRLRGKARAAEYSWRTTAEQFAELMREVAR